MRKEPLHYNKNHLTPLQREVLIIALRGVDPEIDAEHGDISEKKDAWIHEMARDAGLLSECDGCDSHFLPEDVDFFDDALYCAECADECAGMDATYADIDSRMNHGKW